MSIKMKFHKGIISSRRPHFEPETIDFFEHADIAIPYDDTIYNSSTDQEITGKGYWNSINLFARACKKSHGLTIGLNNLSNAIDAVWLMIGSNSTKCKYNFINPDDTDAAHRGSFFGGWTFGPTGATPNATNAYMNTHWDSLSKAAGNRLAFGLYRRTLATGGLSGTWDLNNPTRIYDMISSAAGQFQIGIQGGLLSAGPYTRSHSVKVDALGVKTFSHGAVQYTFGGTTYTPIAMPFYIGARNNNNVSINNYMDGEIGSYWISGAVEFTDQQMLDMNSAFDNLMLALGRAV